jgi:hypothetical protein
VLEVVVPLGYEHIKKQVLYLLAEDAGLLGKKIK